MFDYTIKQMKEKLRIYKKNGSITERQYRTLLGVARTGDTVAAEKGLEKIMRRKNHADNNRISAC